MRLSVIVLLSLIAAALVVAGLALPTLSTAPPTAIVPYLLAHSPTLTITALAGYALAALLLVTVTLIGDMMAVHRRLVHLADMTAPSRRDVAAAIGSSRLRRLVPVDLEAATQGTLVIRDEAKAEDARREIAWLHYLGLARAQFFTAIVLICVIAALGAAQDYRPILPLPRAIPVLPALILLGGLILLAGLARLAIDVAGEPITDTIRRLPRERRETVLLRHISELLDTRTAAVGPAPSAWWDDLAERLAATVGENQRSCLEAVAQLSAAAETLGTTICAATATLESALRVAKRHTANSPELTADRLGKPDDAASEEGSRANAGLGLADRGLGRDLATLLHELDAKT